MRYVVDIDGTICTGVPGAYLNAKPYTERIAAINKLYDEGHVIIYHSARGMSRPDSKRINEMTELTYTQLHQWGCKFHKLIMGKPAGDVYIDDKGINADEFFAT